MQCPSCNSKWDLDPSVSQLRIKTCPFCGASLEPEEKPDLSTIEGILRSIVLKYGEKIYDSSNAQQFKALLNDLASNFPKERDQLRIAIDKQIPSRLLKKNDSDDEEKSHEAIESTYILVDGIGLQPLIAQKTVALLVAGLGWMISVAEIADTNKSNPDWQKRCEEISKRFNDLSEKYEESERQLKTVKILIGEKENLIAELSKNYKELFEKNQKIQITIQDKEEKHLVNTTEKTQKNNVVRREYFILVEGGTFLMGSNDGADDEKPIHSVTVSSFFMCDHEVTQWEYFYIMGMNPSFFRGDNRPVEKVTWFDAIDYCNALSRKEGLTPCYAQNGRKIMCNFDANGYRLPTEAEWEYAARGGNKTNGYTYSGSDSADNVVWYYDNSREQTHDVAAKTPNELGLYDMSGNVWEWCWDWYGSYASSSQTNPTGTSSGSARIARGGSCNVGASFCRVAFRSYGTPSCSINNLGFRVVRSSSR